MLLKPSQRSKSYDNVFSTTTEYEEKEKKKLTKVESAGTHERSSDNPITVLPDFNPHAVNTINPADLSYTKQVGYFDSLFSIYRINDL